MIWTSPASQTNTKVIISAKLRRVFSALVIFAYSEVFNDVCTILIYYLFDIKGFARTANKEQSVSYMLCMD